MNRAIAMAMAGLGLGAIAAAALAAPAAPAGNAVQGKTVFMRCAACHAVGDGPGGKMGPNLAGVYGRKAGSVAGYTYSPALKGSGLKWDEASLSRFLASPRQTVPGTKMAFAGLSNPQDRANVIAYLKTSGKK